MNDSGADNDGEGGMEMEDDDINMQVYDQDVNDYVYIVDDAVDAILGVMQYCPPGSNPPPVVVVH